MRYFSTNKKKKSQNLVYYLHVVGEIMFLCHMGIKTMRHFIKVIFRHATNEAI